MISYFHFLLVPDQFLTVETVRNVSKQRCFCEGNREIEIGSGLIFSETSIHI